MNGISSAATAGSRTSGASQRATTNSLGTTSQPCASLPPWHSGFSRARFPLLGQHGERVGTRMTTGNHEGEVGMSSQRVSGSPRIERLPSWLGGFLRGRRCTLAGSFHGDHGLALRPPFLGLELTRGIGAIMILAGVPGLVDAFARFAPQGRHPAPIAPTRNFVVTGLYRYVRNPVVRRGRCHDLGQAVLMGDWRLIVDGALFWLACHVFVVAYEEPTPSGRLGESTRRSAPPSRAGYRG